MAEFENIKFSIDDSFLTLTIARENKMNALNMKTLEEIRLALQSALDDKNIKGIIITGAGEKAFVAGADIDEIAGLNELNGRKFSENGQETFALIENSHIPVVAAINGYALGGGLELAMACHIRVAIDSAKLGLPEVSLGMIPGYGGTQRLTQLVGKGKALEMMMTGEPVSAAEGYRLNLVNHIVSSHEELFSKSKELLKKIAANAPLAVGMLVSCVNAVYYYDENGYQTEANSFSSCCKTEDFREGVNAFVEKRKPVFKGE
jgi:enoyl-CoA hydratase